MAKGTEPLRNSMSALSSQAITLVDEEMNEDLTALIPDGFFPEDII
jgi:hypothetical protein